MSKNELEPRTPEEVAADVAKELRRLQERANQREKGWLPGVEVK